MVKCAIVSCGLCRHKKRPITFHLFPKHPTKKKLWLDAIGDNLRPNLKEIYVCSLHFEEHDFNRTLGVLRLRDEAVPSLFSSPQKDPLKRTTTKSPKKITSTRKRGKNTVIRLPLNEHKYKICRVCMTDGALEPVPNELESSFLDITGTQTYHDALNTNLPLALCNSCWYDFYKCLAFRENTQKANEALFALKIDVKLNKKNIKQLSSSLPINKKDKNVSNKKDVATNTGNPTLDNGARVNSKTIQEEDNDNAYHSSHRKLNHYYEEFCELSNDPNNQSNEEITIYYTRSEDEFSENEPADTPSNLEEPPAIVELSPKNNKRKAEPIIALASPQKKVNIEKEHSIEPPKATVIDHNYCSLKPKKIEEFSIDLELETEDVPDTALNSDSENEATRLSDSIPNNKKESFSDFNSDSYTAVSENVLLQKYRNNTSNLNEKERDKIDIQMKNIPPIRTTVINKVTNKEDPFPLEEMFVISKLSLDEQKVMMGNRKNSAHYIDSPFKCTDCYKGFKKEFRYNTHRLRHSDLWGKFECDLCKFRFPTKWGLHKHMWLHNSSYVCRLCDYNAGYRSKALRHGLEHKGKVTTFQCPHCGKQFTKSTSLLGHLRIKHVTKFVCQFCGYSFLGAKGLAGHKNLKHRFEIVNNIVPTDDGPTCSSCNIKFISDDALYTHQKVSHAKTPDEQLRNADVPRDFNPRKCYICHLEITDGRLYRNHFNLHHPEVKRIRDFTSAPIGMCELCGKTFKNITSLKNHAVVHTGEKPYQCEECDRRFSFDSSLYLHVRKVHRPKDNRPADNRPKKKYPCSICGKEFPNSFNRLRHMVIHTGMRPHNCEICGKSFKTKPEVKGHVLHVHMKVPWHKKKRKNKTPVQAASSSSAQPVEDNCRT